MPPPLPHQVGPCSLTEIARLVLMQAPREFAQLIERAGGQFDRGARNRLQSKSASGPL